jgi:hypothetical protein
MTAERSRSGAGYQTAGGSKTGTVGSPSQTMGVLRSGDTGKRIGPQWLTETPCTAGTWATPQGGDLCLGTNPEKRGRKSASPFSRGHHLNSVDADDADVSGPGGAGLAKRPHEGCKVLGRGKMDSKQNNPGFFQRAPARPVRAHRTSWPSARSASTIGFGKFSSARRRIYAGIGNALYSWAR